uniref:CLIP-associating protein 1 n=1 Tax=Cairina moschata TaxID=8855 RepID=A0A8C3CC24_CAIMO
MESPESPFFQVQQKDVGRRLQVGQELLEYLRDPAASPDVEQDPQRLDKVIDELAAWVNSSNFKVNICQFFCCWSADNDRQRSFITKRDRIRLSAFFFFFFHAVCDCRWSALPSSGGGVDLYC